jgi:Zn-dependent alcohol dehydrogenase
MQTRAAVVREINKLTIETVELDAPKASEVLVRVRAAGVCHSDLHMLDETALAFADMEAGTVARGVIMFE